MLLTSIIFILISSLIILSCSSAISTWQVRAISLSSVGAVMVLSCCILASYSNMATGMQDIIMFNLGFTDYLYTFMFGFDGISLAFFLLSNFLVLLCLLFFWNEKAFRELSIFLILVQLFLVLTFSVLDVFLFYVFFEAILIPMFIIIGVWGSRSRKIRAVYLFFFYTLCGSILFLIAILYILKTVGTMSFEVLSGYNFTLEEQKLLWAAFFISFASKIPMFPFHIWLPEAHVEAPTIGSVLLAGILLKLGVYGFVRFSIVLFPEASIFFSPLLCLLGVLGIIHGSLAAIRQVDLKRVIAYSSVAHMNLIVVGIFSLNLVSLQGAVLQSISHGFVSGGLFLLIGMIYERYHTRDLFFYTGVVHIMPVYIIFFFLFTLSNIAVPGTSSFVGEFLLLLGIFKSNALSSIVCGLGVILSAIYALWLCNRLAFGNILISFDVSNSVDLNWREFFIMFSLLVFIFIFGLSPNSILVMLEASISKLSIFY